MSEGASEDEARLAVAMLDSQGLLFEGREAMQDDKRPFALTSDDLSRLGFEPADHYDLETVVRALAPTILIGTSGKPGAFSEAAVRADGRPNGEPDRPAALQPDGELRGHAR